MLNKILKSLFIMFVLFFSQQTFAENITGYKVDIDLQTDSSMLVTETIDYDFDSGQRHGIFRFIPLNFNITGQEKFGRQRTLKFDNISILRNGLSEPYTLDTKDSNNNYFIKIGNPNEKITGLQQYTIQYRVNGSIRYFENYDEIYWNAIGLDWKIPIENVQVVLRSDTIIFNDASCYVGSVDSNTPCNINTSADKKSIHFLQTHLGPRQGVTIAASFDKGLVDNQQFFGLSLMGVIGVILTAIVSLATAVFAYIRKYQRKYFVHDPIHARYTPPDDLHPTLIGKITDKKLHPRDISAGIIQLAIGGHITIEKINKKSFFGNSDDYIFTLKKEKEVSEYHHIHNILIDILFGDVYVLQKLGGGRSKKMSEISSGFISVYITKLHNHINKLSVEQGYFEKRDMAGNWIVLIPIILVFGFFISGMIIPGIISFTATFLTFMLIGTIGDRYTEKGWKTKHAINGFQLFLEMTEKERYEFHNAPAKNPQEFMQYLPYAIALGVEEKWAEQFKDITIQQPDWYMGDTVFAPSAFTADISRFSEHVSSTIATRSSGGSGSGSSGGGSSGGGSGGGGGGSW